MEYSYYTNAATATFLTASVPSFRSMQMERGTYYGTSRRSVDHHGMISRNRQQEQQEQKSKNRRNSRNGNHQGQQDEEEDRNACQEDDSTLQSTTKDVQPAVHNGRGRRHRGRRPSSSSFSNASSTRSFFPFLGQGDNHDQRPNRISLLSMVRIGRSRSGSGSESFRRMQKEKKNTFLPRSQLTLSGTNTHRSSQPLNQNKNHEHTQQSQISHENRQTQHQETVNVDLISSGNDIVVDDFCEKPQELKLIEQNTSPPNFNHGNAVHRNMERKEHIHRQTKDMDRISPSFVPLLAVPTDIVIPNDGFDNDDIISDGTTSTTQQPTTTTTTWTWELSNVHSLPVLQPTMPLERSSIRVSNSTISLGCLTSRISNFMKLNGITTVYHSDDARVDCLAWCGLKFVIQLWYDDIGMKDSVDSHQEGGVTNCEEIVGGGCDGKNNNNGNSVVVVEIQRRRGCCVAMKCLRKRLRSAIIQDSDHPRFHMKTKFFVAPPKLLPTSFRPLPLSSSTLTASSNTLQRIAYPLPLSESPAATDMNTMATSEKDAFAGDEANRTSVEEEKKDARMDVSKVDTTYTSSTLITSIMERRCLDLLESPSMEERRHGLETLLALTNTDAVDDDCGSKSTAAAIREKISRALLLGQGPDSDRIRRCFLKPFQHKIGFDSDDDRASNDDAVIPNHNKLDISLNLKGSNDGSRRRPSLPSSVPQRSLYQRHQSYRSLQSSSVNGSDGHASCAADCSNVQDVSLLEVDVDPSSDADIQLMQLESIQVLLNCLEVIVRHEEDYLCNESCVTLTNHLLVKPSFSSTPLVPFWPKIFQVILNDIKDCCERPQHATLSIMVVGSLLHLVGTEYFEPVVLDQMMMFDGRHGQKQADHSDQVRNHSSRAPKRRKSHFSSSTLSSTEQLKSIVEDAYTYGQDHHWMLEQESKKLLDCL